MDRLGKLAISDHILDLKVFIGNQVARRDERVCLLSGKILALPLNFQMLLGQLLAGFLSIGRCLLLAGKSPLESFQPVFSFAIVPGVGDSVSLGVGQEAFEPDINAQLLPRWYLLNPAFGIDTELAIVAVCTPDNTNPLDQLERKLLDTLIGIANQFEATNPTAIGEDDVSAIWIKLPTCGLILHAPVVVLKSGISLLSRFLVLAILIEARDSKPCTLSCRLTSHRIETTCEGVFLGKNSTVSIQVVLVDTTIIHLQSQAFVANELDSTNSFINGSKLFLASIKLVLVDQHVRLLLSRIWIYYLTYVNISIFMIEERKMNIVHVERYTPMPKPHKRNGALIPRLKAGVFPRPTDKL